MKNKPARRDFLKTIGIGGAVAFLPKSALSLTDKKKVLPQETETVPGPIAPAKREYNGVYKGQRLNRIAFPIGGLGAGMFCLEGSGAISQISTQNQPDVFNDPGMFAAIHVKGVANGAKLLEGPVPDWKHFGMHNSALGYGGSAMGLPHFSEATFKTEFPFCIIALNDKDIPLKVEIKGWSPFIPSDEDNSGLPVGAIEYKFTNPGKLPVNAVFSFNTKNILSYDKGRDAIKPTKNGFILSQAGKEEKPMRSDFAVFTLNDNTVVDHCWFRGGWWDPFTMAWNAVKNGEIKSNPPVPANAPGASLYVPVNLMPGQEKTIKLLLAWYTPETELTQGKPGPKKVTDLEKGICNSPEDIQLDKYSKGYNGKFHKPWYSGRFDSINAMVDYWGKNYADLKHKSTLFTNAFYSSTLPPEVIEAVACNLSILKSPTQMRQFDGRFWSWEGTGDSWGSDPGSCTHVLNYAQAVANLFPALERTLRATEFCEDQDERGHQNFRATLPIQPNTHNFHAAADGQLGGIMKVYRDWRISGDNEWMKKLYPMVKLSLDYCIATWDPRNRGVIEEPHHNTYDIEFWGADGMHASFYIGALNAFCAMGQFLGKDVSHYQQLAAKGKHLLETELYDGEYFIQQINYTSLTAKNPATANSYGGEYSAEALQLLQKEGPKYQYGIGCMCDGVLGAWIAAMCGVESTIDQRKIKSHLLAVHKYNHKQSLREHANPQRPSYALGDEGGLLVCTWPKGGKLSLPFVYSDEVWTGLEHQVASHLMMNGDVNEGLEILRTSRDRYDGRIRNPFNEYEWGAWYSRALASYGYLQALTGARYDAVDKTLYIDSKIGDFTSFISTNTGFGTVSLLKGKPSVKISYGNIAIEKVLVSGREMEFSVNRV
jgi:uncharacterized protein (DUF608 family)